MIKEAIYKLVNREDLTYDEAAAVMDEIMSGNATQAQMASFLTALRMKGETIEEITALAQGMREKGIKVNTDGEVLEIVGTGGDEVGTFNISTTSAFIIAAGGIPVAKHGNRSVSSKSGAADVLEKLGVNLNLNAEQNEAVLKKAGMCFLFAQVYHSSMKYVGPVRKEVGIRTVFNILGPLTNPAAATIQLLGVYDRDLAKPLAQVLSNLGVTRGVSVYGDGLDEITLAGPTEVYEINHGEITNYTITPEQFGFKTCKLEELIGGTPEENAQITLDILSGKETGPKREVVLMNAGMSLYLGGKAETLEDGVKLAAELIDSGKALEKLEAFKKATAEA
jgi:anthranilate phosphoribosyltransferase